jgi:hypothetical protein
MWPWLRSGVSGILIVVATNVIAQGASPPTSPGPQDFARKAAEAAQQTIDQACAPVDLKAIAPLSEREWLAGYFSIPLGMDNSQMTGMTNNLDVAKAIFERWSNLSCVQSNGRPRLEIFSYAVEKSFGFGPVKGFGPMTPERASRRMDQLRARFPDTPFAVLVEANYWMEAGWDARGAGYSSTVTAGGSDIFEEDMAKAEKVLSEKKDIASVSPEYYVALLSLQGSEGGFSRDLLKTFEEGARRYKSYNPLYTKTLNFAQEKWGGSWAAIDHVINWSVDNTRDSDGEWMYARLYGYVATSFIPHERVFTVTTASWPRMKAGFSDHLRRVPDDQYQQNLFARFACEAGDGPTFLAERRKLGSRLDPEAWGGPLSAPVCEAKFKYRT